MIATKRIDLNKTSADNFFKKIKIKKDYCWDWTGAKGTGGYGMFAVFRKGKMRNFKASRVSYFLFNKKDPKSKIVCHSCDNPSCVNPWHLFLGSHKDNTRDCVNKNRQRNIRKTHCPRGHEYKGDNLIIRTNNSRRCRICVNMLQNKRYHDEIY